MYGTKSCHSFELERTRENSEPKGSIFRFVPMSLLSLLGNIIRSTEQKRYWPTAYVNSKNLYLAMNKLAVPIAAECVI